MHLFPKTHFDFIGWRYRFFAVSALLLGASAASLAIRGVKYGIDFTGGTALQIALDKPLSTSALRAALSKIGEADASIQRFAGTNSFQIRLQTPSSSAEAMESKLSGLKDALAPLSFRVDNKAYVGPSVGAHLFRQALWAIGLTFVGIIVYLAFRFDNPVWGVSGIIALIHDVFATYGLFSIMGAEVDLLIVSALLTIGGYSIHDTIVILDRMREKMRILRGKPLDEVINESMNETLSRTIITSGTVLVVVTILYFFGGHVIHHFALAMVFGTLVGTYSSIAVAAPLVYEWTARHSKAGLRAPSLAGAGKAGAGKPK